MCSSLVASVVGSTSQSNQQKMHHLCALMQSHLASLELGFASSSRQRGLCAKLFPSLLLALISYESVNYQLLPQIKK